MFGASQRASGQAQSAGSAETLRVDGRDETAETLLRASGTSKSLKLGWMRTREANGGRGRKDGSGLDRAWRE